MASFIKQLFKGKSPLGNAPLNLKNNNTRKINMANPMLKKKQVDQDLLAAVENGWVISALDALDKGANPNAMDANKRTPLFLIIMNKKNYFGESLDNRMNLVDLLLQKGANVNLRSDYAGQMITPLQMAVLKNDGEVVDILLRYGNYNSNTSRMNIGKAFEIAEKMGHQNIMNVLYKRGRSMSNSTSDPGSVANSVGGRRRKTRKSRRRGKTQKRKH